MSNGPVAREITVSTIVAPSVSTAGMTTRVVRGSLWTLGGQGVVMLALLISTPFVIRLLGSEAYGILALINVMVGYLAFADMGMGSASTRFAADAHARDDDEGEVAVVWTSLLIALAPAVLAALVFALSAKSVVIQVLRIPDHLHNEAILALRLAAVAFLARAASGVLNTPELVRLRMDLSAYINSGTAAAQNLLIPIALLLGGNLVTAVIVMASMAIACALFHLIVSWRLQPRLLHPRINPALIKPLARFGKGLVLSSLAGMLLTNVEKLLLTRLASVAALAHYSIAFAMASFLAIVPAAMSQSLMPAFSRLQASPEREPLQRLYTRALRGNLLWIAPAALLLCVAAKPFLALWAGPEYSQRSALPFYILVGGIVFNVMAIVPYTLLIASGRSALVARIHMSELLPYVICAFALTYFLGTIGAALAYSLRLVTDALMFFWFAKRSGFTLSPLPANRISYTVAVAVLLLPVLLSLAEVVVSLPALACATFFSLTAYCFLTWKKVLTDDERAWMIAMVKWRRPIAGSV